MGVGNRLGGFFPGQAVHPPLDILLGQVSDLYQGNTAHQVAFYLPVTLNGRRGEHGVLGFDVAVHCRCHRQAEEGFLRLLSPCLDAGGPVDRLFFRVEGPPLPAAVHHDLDVPAARGQFWGWGSFMGIPPLLAVSIAFGKDCGILGNRKEQSFSAAGNGGRLALLTGDNFFPLGLMKRGAAQWLHTMNCSGTRLLSSVLSAFSLRSIKRSNRPRLQPWWLLLCK